MVTTEKPITVYSNKGCPYAQRALIALYETEIEHKLVEIPLPDKPAWYFDINPEGKVPTLAFGEELIYESLIIAEFITDLSEKEYLPKDPLLRAQARYAIDFWGSKINPLTYRLLKSNQQDETDRLKEELFGGLKKFNQLLSAQPSGPYFFGEQYSLVEIALSPFVSRLRPISRFANFEIPQTAELERYSDWASSIQQRPSFVQSSLTAEDLYQVTELLAAKMSSQTPGNCKTVLKPPDSSGLNAMPTPFASDALLNQVIAERDALRLQNNQLWKIVEKQRTIIQQLQKVSAKHSSLLRQRTLDKPSAKTEDCPLEPLSPTSLESHTDKLLFQIELSKMSQSSCAENDDSEEIPVGNKITVPISPLFPPPVLRPDNDEEAHLEEIEEVTYENDFGSKCLRQVSLSEEIDEPSEEPETLRSKTGSLLIEHANPIPLSNEEESCEEAAQLLIHEMATSTEQHEGSGPQSPELPTHNKEGDIPRCTTPDPKLPSNKPEPAPDAKLSTPVRPSRVVTTPVLNSPNISPRSHGSPTNQGCKLTSLIGVDIRVAGSTIKINASGKEVLVFLIGVGRRNGMTRFHELWTVEKYYSDFLALDAQLKRTQPRNIVLRIGKLPDRSLFFTHAPSKVDQRKLALQKYLQHLISLNFSQNADICEFLSTNVAKKVNDNEKILGIKEGYLTKRGKNFGGWKRRYFVLKSPTLQYYEAKDSSYLGSISISQCQVSRQPASLGISDTPYRHAFMIVEPKKNGSGMNRHILCADSDTERDEWVIALNMYTHSAASETESDTSKPAKKGGKLRKLIRSDTPKVSLASPAQRANSPIQPLSPTRSNEHSSSSETKNRGHILSASVGGYEKESPITSKSIHRKSSSFKERLLRSSSPPPPVPQPDRCQANQRKGKLPVKKENPLWLGEEDIHQRRPQAANSVGTNIRIPVGEGSGNLENLLNRRERVNELGRLISALPIVNYTLLRCLIAHLIRIAQHSDVNKMTVRNIGIVFSPTLGIPAGVFNLLMTEFEYIFWVNDEGCAAPKKIEDTESEEEVDPEVCSKEVVEKSTEEQLPHISITSQADPKRTEENSTPPEEGILPTRRQPQARGYLRDQDGRSNRNSMIYADSVPQEFVSMEKELQGIECEEEDLYDLVHPADASVSGISYLIGTPESTDCYMTLSGETRSVDGSDYSYEQDETESKEESNHTDDSLNTSLSRV
ncbi:hypothetical protein K493DRAFT_406428 [Basidiobolus meristosporus CBS 931.73]|uniref:RhoGAP-domain-containing protein n=1 Tax=Basidiobolus meristosporus CBS 931.73 TaxID=1314790 RepID=A0A1Y1YLL6_9FUNG|nr:hypothetical protein K493DRAFT_406428 [Basidiobolus meristosporus CBS 931.73]|eukprot:ORX98900.1 hypothetical protein K493DRAFT_406428 [Basidiobolus meristosporus CBS 931.73]